MNTNKTNTNNTNNTAATTTTAAAAAAAFVYSVNSVNVMGVECPAVYSIDDKGNVFAHIELNGNSVSLNVVNPADIATAKDAMNIATLMVAFEKASPADTTPAVKAKKTAATAVKAKKTAAPAVKAKKTAATATENKYKDAFKNGDGVNVVYENNDIIVYNDNELERIRIAFKNSNMSNMAELLELFAAENMFYSPRTKSYHRRRSTTGIKSVCKIIDYVNSKK